MFEIWISLGHIQIKLFVAYSLQNNFYKSHSQYLSPTNSWINVKNRSMNSMGQYWLCCYYGKNCSVLMFALIWINICVCPYLGVTWEPRRSRCWVGPASPAITKSLLHEHPSNRLTYQNSSLKYKGKNSTSAINNRVDAILFFIVYH